MSSFGEQMYIEGYIFGFVVSFTESYVNSYLSVCYNCSETCEQLYCKGWQIAMEMMVDKYNYPLELVKEIVKDGFHRK